MIFAAEDLGDLIDLAVLLSLPGVLVLAWLVGRLLGVRRSWTTTLLSGVIGWIGGVATGCRCAPAGGAPGRNAPAGCRRRGARASLVALHDPPPRSGHGAERGDVQRPAPAVLHVRDQPAPRAEHLLPGRVSLFSDPHDERVVTKLVNRTVLALAGGVVGVIGAMLINVRGGPPFAGQTSLYEFFGYFALFCSVVLIMRVVVSVLHDGVN